MLTGLIRRVSMVSEIYNNCATLRVRQFMWCQIEGEMYD